MSANATPCASKRRKRDPYAPVRVSPALEKVLGRAYLRRRPLPGDATEEALLLAARHMRWIKVGRFGALGLSYMGLFIWAMIALGVVLNENVPYVLDQVPTRTRIAVEYVVRSGWGIAIFGTILLAIVWRFGIDFTRRCPSFVRYCLLEPGQRRLTRAESTGLLPQFFTDCYMAGISARELWLRRMALPCLVLSSRGAGIASSMSRLFALAALPTFHTLLRLAPGTYSRELLSSLGGAPWADTKAALPLAALLLLVEVTGLLGLARYFGALRANSEERKAVKQMKHDVRFDDFGFHARQALALSLGCLGLVMIALPVIAIVGWGAVIMLFYPVIATVQVDAMLTLVLAVPGSLLLLRSRPLRRRLRLAQLRWLRPGWREVDRRIAEGVERWSARVVQN